jgi:hypothetical protein
MNMRDLMSASYRAVTIAALALAGCSTDEGSDSSDTGPSGGKFDTPSSAPDYCAEKACADRLADSAARNFVQPGFIRWQCGDVSGVTGPAGAGGEADCAQFNDGVRSGDLDVAVACHQGTPGCQIDDVSAWNDGEFESTSCVATAVAGGDDRGQEYCEYFAVIDGSLIAPEADDENSWREVAVLGRTTSSSNGAPYGFDFDGLGGEQLIWLEEEADFGDDPAVGSCVFTSWHWDTTAPSRGSEPYDVHGIDVNFENFRMFGRFNNNGAARKLVFDGLHGIAIAAERRRDGDQPAAQHPFWAACMGMVDCPRQGTQCGGGVEWRVSDPTIAAATALMTECGCFVELPDGERITDAETIAAAVVPQGGEYPVPFDFDGVTLDFLRGFRIGTWNDPNGLPAGCRYVEHDADFEQGLPDTHTLVTCDIRASDLANTTNAGELKEFCRRRYGDEVIVHVPLPGDIIKCEPPEDAGPYCQGLAPWAMDDLPPTVTLTADDLEPGAACRVSAAGDGDERGGSQIDGEAGE